MRPQEQKSANGSTSQAARWERPVNTHTSAGMPAVAEPTQPSPVHYGQAPRVSELQRAHTPLRRSAFEHELANHPDKTLVAWLLDAIDNGVSLGYTGPRAPYIARNLTSALHHSAVIDKELAREVEAGRILGPYSDRPLPNLHCSGLGVVPKHNDKWRVIMHLSAPPGNSINDYIPPENYSMHYSTVDDAVRLLTAHPPGALMAKVDLKAAFRMVPVRRQDWELLGIYWRQSFYVDTCLPFGCRSSPFLFTQFAEALQWILHHNYHLSLVHYLDDFFLTGPPHSDTCSRSVTLMLRVCTELGIPVALDKLEGPATCITYLGIEVDAAQQVLRLPDNKLQALLQELKTWKTRCRHKTTKRRLLSLIGKLSFATKVVPAGRLFLRRLIDLSTTARKLHHRVTLNKEARADILWWHQFLPAWNGVAMFLEAEWTDAEALQLFTDASRRWGYGAYFAGDWLRGDWSPSQRSKSIQWQELFAIVAAVTTWGSRLQGRRIRISCDNKAIVQAWQRKSGKHPDIVDLLRRLFLTAARQNFTIKLCHIPGKYNCIADALSRNQLTRFFHLAPQASPVPTATPDALTQL